MPPAFKADQAALQGTAGAPGVVPHRQSGGLFPREPSRPRPGEVRVQLVRTGPEQALKPALASLWKRVPPLTFFPVGHSKAKMLLCAPAVNWPRAEVFVSF